MKKENRVFVVSGVTDVGCLNSQPTGSMERFSSFVESTGGSLVETVVSMLNNYEKAINTDYGFTSIQVTFVINSSDPRSFRTPLKNSLRSWAEKCRVKGLRGWRVNAIQTPDIRKTGYDEYTVRTQVILSNNIIYNQNRKKEYTSDNLDTDINQLVDNLNSNGVIVSDYRYEVK